MRFMSSYGAYEIFNCLYILDARLHFEAGVDVKADTFVMMKQGEPFGIVWPYAPRKQEGQGTTIASEDFPVELLAAAAVRRALCVKEKKIRAALKRPYQTSP